MGSRRVVHDCATSLSLFTFMHWRRKWQPTPVFLPGESQGWGSLVGCRLWGRTESAAAAAELGSEPQAPLPEHSFPGGQTLLLKYFQPHYSVTCFKFPIPNKRTAICKYFHIWIVQCGIHQIFLNCIV